MKSMKFVSGAIAGAFLIGALLAPGIGAAQSPETLRIYSSLPLTGLSARQTITIVNAINLAIEQKTEGGLICNGKFRIHYVPLNNDATAASGQRDSEKEEENANMAVSDPDAMVYIGAFDSGAAEVAIPILNQAKPGPLAMISPSNAYPGLTKPASKGEPDVYYPTGKRNFARIVTADDVQGAVAARWAMSLGARRIYIIDDAQLYGKGLADVVEQTAKQMGLTVLGHDSIAGDTADYRALAARIKKSDPQLIYYGGAAPNSAGQLLKAIRAAGVTAPFMGADGIKDDAFIKAAGADVANGARATVAGTPRERLPEAGRKFYADYFAKFKSEPEVDALYGYEATGVVLDALGKVCRKDRAAINDAIQSTRNYTGVLGAWSFNDGDTTLTNVIGHRVVGGRWQETDLPTFP
jgi:branched-chain amino acid transport system substrate-binding protein